MPLVRGREQVLNVYADAAGRGWVIPTFCAENLTTIEAVLSAVKDYGDHVGERHLPVTIAITNLYPYRSQSANYTHTRQWDIGLRLFMADLQVLTSENSPFADLNVMIHLDHIHYELDKPLLSWDMCHFSSIMFDASSLPIGENIKVTSFFMNRNGADIVVEGACDEIHDASGNDVYSLTTPEKAEDYFDRTGVDFIVANLGTEHRASQADLKYHADLAREIKARVGTKLVLHGCSSVSNDQIKTLFNDGVCKVNIWTALERDSSPILLKDMVRNAAKVAGAEAAMNLAKDGYLGTETDLSGKASLGYFTSCYRQDIIFHEMKRIVTEYLRLWYV